MLAFLLLLGMLGTQIYFSLAHERQLAGEYELLQEKLRQVSENKQEIERELEYLGHPENLSKELKARFNYREAGETMIIIVPPKASSAVP